MIISVCAPQAISVEIERNFCPTCLKRQFFIVSCYEWYDPMSTCLFCGDVWHGGTMQERPFKPKWRKEQIESARQFYRQQNAEQKT